MTIFSTVQKEYTDWGLTKEKIKEINLKIEEIDLKIIFVRGCLIFPIPNCFTPSEIENTVNIVSSDNEKIRKKFEETLIKADDYYRNCTKYYHFSKDSRKFELRFFPNEHLLKEKLRKEEIKYASMETTRWECVVS